MSECAVHEPSGITLRSATADDIPEILRQRRAMYEAMDYEGDASLVAMVKLSAGYLAAELREGGSVRAWLACDGARVVGGGAIVISLWPPHPYDLECRRATILNVYTDADYRRRGVGRHLMQTMIDWCKREGFARVNLHASRDGRHLYESLGFETGNETVLKLR